MLFQWDWAVSRPTRSSLAGQDIGFHLGNPVSSPAPGYVRNPNWLRFVWEDMCIPSSSRMACPQLVPRNRFLRKPGPTEVADRSDGGDGPPSQMFVKVHQ